jgi:orotidine-5'-phosphate decarboxylase
MTQYWPFSGIIRHASLRERLIVSLDMADRRAALRLVERVGQLVGMFRVGRNLYLGGGPELVREIRKRGGEVFLDLKFHDNPRNVTRAAVEATRLGVRMFDIHPNGCCEALARTRNEVARVCRAEGLRRPHILAVAMLAGLSTADTHAGCSDRVLEIARQAANASLDGVLTPAREVSQVRATCGRRFIIVTSGIRLHDEPGYAGAGAAAEAIRAGADYLVVGSPIWRAAEPVRAVRDITEDMERGLRANLRPPIEVLGVRPL